MKKVLVTLSLVVTLGLGAIAQNDAFFSYSDVDKQQRNGIIEINPPQLPALGEYSDQAPVGSGLLILAGMGVAYALKRRNNN
ncbi:MAG: LPXTG cell wall anchor domain-containing protein [Bacteroidales bacterium]|nr:LPXTG cell wall anchor domain-containing protein [Bacteroidales bacterium]